MENQRDARKYRRLRQPQSIAGFSSMHIGTAAAARRRTAPQWLVPSERLIELQSLYLPTGLSVGMRIASLKVAA